MNIAAQYCTQNCESYSVLGSFFSLLGNKENCYHANSFVQTENLLKIGHFIHCTITEVLHFTLRSLDQERPCLCNCLNIFAQVFCIAKSFIK